MGLGKIGRRLGNAGMAVEAAGYLWTAGAALVKAIRGKPSPGESAQRVDDPQDGPRDRGADNEGYVEGG